MRSRQEIKAFAKQAFLSQRSNCVLAVFLVLLVPFGIGFLTSIPNVLVQMTMISQTPNVALLTTTVAISFFVALISIPVGLLYYVLEVNLNGSMVKVYYGQQITSTEPYTDLKINFGRKLGGMLWMYLWIFLWALIGVFTLHILTIIKALAYSMSPYILASNPNVTATEALKLSRRMTKGHKGKIFVMALSFIGWQLLNALTLGILGIFYVNPYMFTSFAGLFVELRNNAVVSGAINPAELDGVIMSGYPQQPPVSPYAPYPQQPPVSPYAPYPQQPPVSPYAAYPQQPPVSPYAPQSQPPIPQPPAPPPPPPPQEQPSIPQPPEPPQPPPPPEPPKDPQPPEQI